MSKSYVIPAKTSIGHVHLKVSDLDRALAFYQGVLGFDLKMRIPGAAFLSAGGYHHHIALNTWQSEGGQPAPRNTAGLFHIAILYPSRKDLAVATQRVLDSGISLEGASDHGVSEAVYLRDPDDNGVELYHDRSIEEWPMDENGDMKMFTARLDVPDLLSELDQTG